MPLQRADDAARNLRNIWHGPTNAWRWPFDATYTEWSVGIATFLLSAFLLWWIVPLGIGMVLCSLAVSRLLIRMTPKERLAWYLRTTPDNARRRAGKVFPIALVILLLALLPYPFTWLLPAPFWLGIPAGLFFAVRAVRAARPWIDGNRPVGYWISTLLGIARRPARAHRDPVAIGFTGGPAVPDQTMDDAVIDFLADVAAIDPEEVIVPLYRERTPVVRALLWDSRTRRAETCENVIAVLQAAGIRHSVPEVTRREERLAGGQYAMVRTSVTLLVEGTKVPDDTVITLDAEGQVAFVSRAEFGRRFEMVSPVPECPAHPEVTA